MFTFTCMSCKRMCTPYIVCRKNIISYTGIVIYLLYYYVGYIHICDRKPRAKLYFKYRGYIGKKIEYLYIYICIHKSYLPNLILLLSNELFINDFNMSSMYNSSNLSLWILQIIIALKSSLKCNLICVMLFLSMYLIFLTH